MAYVLANKVKQDFSASGSGALLVDGAVATGFRGLSSVLATNDVFRGIVSHQSVLEFQSGIWSYSAGSISLLRLGRSSTGSAMTFSAGTKTVQMGTLAEDLGWETITANATAYPDDKLHVIGAVTITLFASPTDGQVIAVNYLRGAAPTVNGNGKLIELGGQTDTTLTFGGFGLVFFVFDAIANYWTTR